MVANGYIDSPGPSQIGTALDWIGTGQIELKVIINNSPWLY